MEKILNYLKDFCKLFEYIENKKLGKLNMKNRELYIKKCEFMKLLEVNEYDTPNNKLKVWRALGFIHTSEKNRLTKKIRDGEETKRVIALNLDAYEALKEINSSKKSGNKSGN